MGQRLTDHEEAALREIVAWRSPKRTPRGRAADWVERVIERAIAFVPTKLVDRALGFVLPRMRDLTWRATSEGLVLRAYRRAGAPVASVEEIAGVDLATADKAAGDKRLQEAAVAGIEGAAAGFFGGFTLAADVGAVLLLSMRAVQSRALAYGFDPSSEEELEFVLVVLDTASRLGPQSKTSARVGLSQLGRQMMTRDVTRRAVEKVIERLPAQLAARYAAMKSESVVPVLGAVTGMAFNAWYLQAVTHTARMAYRERFLRRKYGDDLLAAYGA